MTTLSVSRAERIAALNFDYAAQPKEGIAPCNLCDADRWVVLAHRDRYGFPAQVTACARCGCTTLNPRMTNAAYAEFYRSVYRPLVSAYHGREIHARSIQGEQVEYSRAVIDFLRPLTKPAHRTLLDVGGSTGVVARELAQAFGVRATVIDPAPAETAEAEAMGIECVTGFVESWDAGGRTFDLVGMFQTVDHLLDVRGTLAKLRDVITEDGLFIVDIVDFRAAYLRNRSVEDAVKVDHVYSLTQEVMEAYLARAGFAWVRKSYAADHLHVLYACEPCRPNPSAAPEPHWVREYFSELREVMNRP